MNTVAAEALAMFKVAAGPPVLKGKLYLSQSGFLLMSVPNAIGRGAFDALAAPGIELPLSDSSGHYNAHVTVMRPDEIEQFGGPGKISERGHDFGYSMGKIKDFNPVGWKEMNRCWVMEVKSPELEKLRRSYGLPSLPVHEDSGRSMPFHITFAVRRDGVLGDNNKSKVEGADNGKVRRKSITWDKPGVQIVKAAETFTNELGNEISLEGGIKDDRLNYQMTGPTSVMDNTVTLREAQKLKGLLTNLLASQTPKRTRVVMPHGDGYLLEKMNNPKFPNTLGRRRFPGGGIDEGETARQAAAREMMEELGLKVDPEKLEEMGVHQGDYGLEQYFRLNDHGLEPGTYESTVGGDKIIELLSGQASGDDYWGPDLNSFNSEVGRPVSEKTAEVTLAQSVAIAARKAVKPKSEAQADAGNYQKGHVSMHGMRITIETRKGQRRSPEWPPLANHYGYIRQTEGKDGDHVDVFLGPDPQCELVWVVDQRKPGTKTFDEHKCMVGFTTRKDAKAAYLANYSPGWQGFGSITPLTITQFRGWLEDGDQKKAIADQTFKMKKAADDEDPESDDSPGILVIQKTTTIRMIVPDNDDKLENKEELINRLQDEFERLLERFDFKDDSPNGKKS